MALCVCVVSVVVDAIRANQQSTILKSLRFFLLKLSSLVYTSGYGVFIVKKSGGVTW